MTPLVPVTSYLMAVSIVFDRDPVATSSLASLMKDDACSRLTVTGLSGDGTSWMLKDVKGSLPVMGSRLKTAEEVGVAVVRDETDQLELPCSVGSLLVLRLQAHRGVFFGVAYRW